MPLPPAIARDILRDRLANERTLLAWLRTAIALMGFGLVVARFGRFLKTMVAMQTGPSANDLALHSDRSHIIGAGLLLLGAAVALCGWQRTHAYGRIIDPHGGGPSQRVLGATAIMVAALGLGLAAYVAILERAVQ